MEHLIYIEAIKKALKSRGLTYEELASSLQMTESGVKKMLNGKDISIQRIIQICKVLDILPGQIFSLSEKSSLPILHLSDKQQEALIHDRKLLAIYWLLTIEKKSFDQIVLQLKTTPSELKIRLQKLVTLDLVTQRRSQFFPKHQGKFRWPDDSKLARVLNSEWSQHTLKKALSFKDPQDTYHRFAALKLSEASYRKYQQRFYEIFEEMAQQSEREELTSAQKKLSDFTFVVAATKGGVFES
jgi:transcriptional regulator with XRE-family HTH domain